MTKYTFSKLQEEVESRKTLFGETETAGKWMSMKVEWAADLVSRFNALHEAAAAFEKCLSEDCDCPERDALRHAISEH